MKPGPVAGGGEDGGRRSCHETPEINLHRSQIGLESERPQQVGDLDIKTENNWRITVQCTPADVPRWRQAGSSRGQCEPFHIQS